MISISAFPKCWLEDIVEGKMELFDWIDRSMELDCDGLELYSGFLTSHRSDYLGEVRQRIEALGMAASMMCYSPDFTIPDPEGRKIGVEKQIEMIRVTGELGGRFCRTLSGQSRSEVSIDQGIDWVVGCIESCLPAAEKCGVDLVIENHYKDGYWAHVEFAQKRDVFLRLIERIDSPHFGIQYDPIELLETVVDRVRTMHASDRHLLPSGGSRL